MVRRIVLPVVGLTALLHLPWLLARGFPVRQDALRATLPWWTFTRRELLAGRLPAWDPARLAGTPHMANLQAGVFYPPNWPLVPLPPHVAAGLSLAGHVALGGILLALFARSLNVRDAAAALAGLAFVAGAFVSARTFAAHLQIVQAVAWAPLLWLAARELALRAEPRRAGLGALAAALSFLAGYPAMTAYALAAAAVLFLGSLPGSAAARRALALAVGAGVAGLLLVTPALWPFLELVGQTTRARGLPIERAASGELGLGDLWVLVWPWFHGAEPLGSFLGFSDWYWHEIQGAGGLALTALAAYGVWIGRSRRPIRLLALIAGGALLLALGTRTPVYALLYAAAPALGAFRIPARYLVLVALVAPVLAALGLDALLRRRSRLPAPIVRFGLLAGGGVAVVQLWAVGGGPPGIVASFPATGGPQFQTLEEAGRTAALLNAVVAVAGLGVLAAVAHAFETNGLPCRLAAAGMQAAVLLDLLLVAVPSMAAPAYSVESVEESLGTANVATFRASGERIATSAGYSLLANLGTLAGYRTATAYDPLLLGRTTRLLRASQTVRDPWGDASNEVLLDRDGGVAFDILGIGAFLERGSSGSTLWFRDSELPRLSLVERAGTVRTPAESLAAVLAPGFDPHAEAVVEGRPGTLPSGGPVADEPRVEIVRERPGLIEARVAAPRGGYLLFSESYYPGWRAESGGRSVPLAPADHAIMAVRLAPGAHDLTLRFTTPWLAPSLLLFLLGAAGIGVLLLGRPSRWRVGAGDRSEAPDGETDAA